MDLCDSDQPIRKTYVRFFLFVKYLSVLRSLIRYHFIGIAIKLNGIADILIIFVNFFISTDLFLSILKYVGNKCVACAIKHIITE